MGVGLANGLCNVIIFICLVTAHFQVDEIKETIRMPDKRVFEGIYSYLELGLPITFMLGMEFWVYECMCLLCGLISVHAQASYILLNNIYIYYFCLAMGM